MRASVIKLRSGLFLDLRRPRPDQFVFSDIAGALSRICRFGSQTDRHYSVAEHLILCYQQSKMKTAWGPMANRMVLLHDAAEAFVGDMVTPLKNMLPAYHEIEDRISNVIYDKYGVDLLGRAETHTRHVKPIDRYLLRRETRWLAEDESHKPPFDTRLGDPDFLGYPPAMAEFWYTYCAEQAGIDTSK